MASTEMVHTRTELERGMARGWHTGAQIYASVFRETIADFAMGEARPGVPMTPATLVEWASATKSVDAIKQIGSVQGRALWRRNAHPPSSKRERNEIGRLCTHPLQPIVGCN